MLSKISKLNRLKIIQNRAKSVRIGCNSAFWGDSSISATQLIDHGNLDYLVGDYLAEITMSLLAKVKLKNENFGFTPDFLLHIKNRLDQIQQQNIRVITNAGGMNPKALAKKLKSLHPSLKIAAITGDDLMLQNHPKFNAENGYISANSYLGSQAIVEALKSDAQIIITGRVVDSALVTASLVFETQVQPDDFDCLSTFSLAGHLIECGAHATGGIFTDWEQIADGFWNIGFPIVEFDLGAKNLDQFLVTKPDNTGGQVTFGTVAEQLVYEIDDPENYVLPDVVCDWSGVELSEIGKNLVQVKGAKGKPPTSELKVSATTQGKFVLKSTCLIFGGKSVTKAVKSVEGVFQRVETVLKTKFSRKLIYPIGAGFSQTGQFTETSTGETAVWIAAEHENKKVLDFLAIELASIGTGGAPGFTALIGGRPKASPVFRLEPKARCSRSDCQIEIFYSDDDFQKGFKFEESQAKNFTNLDEKSRLAQISHEGVENFQPEPKTKIQDLAFCRSGDKGNHCNIGVVARDSKYYQFLDEKLTVEFMEKNFKHFFDEEIKIEKFYLPGICGFNFMLYDSLGGGGVASLRPDPQGKSYGQLLASLTL